MAWAHIIKVPNKEYPSSESNDNRVILEGASAFRILLVERNVVHQ